MPNLLFYVMVSIKDFRMHSLAAIQVLNREKNCIRSNLGILSLGNFSIARKKVLVNSENVAY